MVPGVLRVIPSTCITFLVYENSRKLFGSALRRPATEYMVKLKLPLNGDKT